MRNEKRVRLKRKKILTVHIASPSDVCGLGLIRNLWGDTWVKNALSIALKSLGYSVLTSRPDKKPPDVLIHLSGGEIEYIYKRKIEQLSNSIYKIVWVYSHPERPTPTNLRGYDRIYCCSTRFTKKLQRMGYTNTRVMLGATSKRPLKVPNNYDIVFVGNTRGPRREEKGRLSIDYLKSIGKLSYRIGIWGNNWEGKIPDSWYRGRYYPYSELAQLYASSTICLQDHRPEMSREGFVSVKIFDILASGSLPISNSNIGLREIFKGAVPEYKSAQELKQLLHKYINNPKERARLISLGQKIAFACTWKKRATLFMEELRG